MADQEIVVPFAFHLNILQTEPNVILRLKRELMNEQVKNNQLHTLVQEQRRTNETLATLIEQVSGKHTVPRVESMDSIASTAVDFDSEAPVVGKYSPAVRRQKIQAYKVKQLRHKQQVHVSRHFRGRSQVAQTKPRLNGRFVKAVH